jgi:hypothetical protein
MGLFSFFFPYLYAVVPVYETNQCEFYFTNPSNQAFLFPLLKPNSDVFKVNIYSYLLFNWLELLLLVLLCFKIRHVKDELSIIKELLWIASFWILSSFSYFLLFSLPNLYPDLSGPARLLISELIFFWIQLRNLSTVVISTAFCIHVVRSPSLVYSAEDPTSLTTLLDFELVMMSVVPYSYFKRFVARHSRLQEEAGNEQHEGEGPGWLYPIYLKLYTTIEIMGEK